MKPETQDRAPGIVIDRALLDRARAKDREALGLLYEASSLEVYRTIHALVRDEDLTLDIQQDTYLQAFSHLDQLREPERFLPWLKQIAVNQARAQLRKKRPTLFTELTPTEEGEEPEFPDLSSQASPELSLDRKETTRLVREILDGLTDGQRLLIGLYYYEELSMSQIAKELGLSVGTVKSQLHRSRKHVETEVRKLEAQGVKLYGLGPLPFLLTLLHRAEPAAEAEGKLLAASVSQSAAGTAPVLETAAVHMGRSFFQTTLGRVTLGLMAAAVVGGGAVGWRWYQNHLERVMGDERPTVYVDSAEDLSTEPTEPTETHPKPDSGEDLIHVPTLYIPTLTEPTEPTETEPASTAPAETNPPKATDPAGPPDPGNPPATTPTKPTEPQSGELNLSWHWDTGTGMDWNATADENGYETRMLTVTMSGSGSPELYAENPEILQITKVSNPGLDLEPIYVANGWNREYVWSVKPLAEGVTKIHCAVEGKIIKSLTVTVKSPDSLLSVIVINDEPFYPATEQTMGNCVVGMEYTLNMRTLGSDVPVVSTDNSAVVHVGTVTNTENPSYHVYCVDAQIVGAGDANLYVSFGGKIQKTWKIHATSATVDLSDSQEDLIPVDAEPQVMSWYANTHQVPLLIPQGGSEQLYIKIKGPDAPTISVDNPAVLSVTPVRSVWHEDRNVSEYWFQLTALGSGVCTVRCNFHGAVAFPLPVVVY